MSNSPCIEHLGGNRYRCRNLRFVITTDVLPIRCLCPAPIGVGSNLKQLLGCDAKRLSADAKAALREMDEHGPAWCEMFAATLIEQLSSGKGRSAVMGPRSAERKLRKAIQRARESAKSAPGKSTP